jgi:hypothetical protein
MKIYVVTKGCYSDYHIIAATTDEKKAQEIKNRFDEDCDPADIEIFDDADICMRDIYSVYFKYDMAYRAEKRQPNDDYAASLVNTVYTHGKPLEGRGVVYVAADSEDEAFKIACEKWAQHKAKEAGIA